MLTAIDVPRSDLSISSSPFGDNPVARGSSGVDAGTLALDEPLWSEYTLVRWSKNRSSEGEVSSSSGPTRRTTPSERLSRYDRWRLAVLSSAGEDSLSAMADASLRGLCLEVLEGAPLTSSTEPGFVRGVLTATGASPTGRSTRGHSRCRHRRARRTRRGLSWFRRRRHRPRFHWTPSAVPSGLPT